MQPVMPAGPASGRPRVLLTGFGPFPGVPVNATMRLVPMLAAAVPAHFPDLACEHLLLATEWDSAPACVAEAFQAPGRAPDLVLHFGVSSRARGFEIETRARNACQASADAAGFLPPARHLNEAGQAYLPATLPVAHVVSRLRAQGIPAFASRDAGAYLCNAVLYRSLQAQPRLGIARLGFVHIPASLARPGAANRGRSGACPLTWPQALAGGLEIIAASLGRPAPRLRAAPRR
ncbi:MAG: pyroglutamyl-peptidase I [Hyphomicrobiaceae bacterium]|nr:pyroglutamyl-peptidase I [Hyphomicrobiaceae bacterium]